MTRTCRLCGRPLRRPYLRPGRILNLCSSCHRLPVIRDMRQSVAQQVQDRLAKEVKP